MKRSHSCDENDLDGEQQSSSAVATPPLAPLAPAAAAAAEPRRSNTNAKENKPKVQKANNKKEI